MWCIDGILFEFMVSFSIFVSQHVHWLDKDILHSFDMCMLVIKQNCMSFLKESSEEKINWKCFVMDFDNYIALWKVQKLKEPMITALWLFALCVEIAQSVIITKHMKVNIDYLTSVLTLVLACLILSDLMVYYNEDWNDYVDVLLNALKWRTFTEDEIPLWFLFLSHD